MPLGLINLLSRLGRDNGGNVAMIFGLMFMPMFAFIGASVDYGMALRARTALQNMTDAAAIAGARLPATSNMNRYNAAQAMLDSTLGQSQFSAAQTNIDASNAEVIVAASYNQPTAIMGLLGVNSIPVAATSAARSQIENGGVVCMLALNPSTDDGLHLQGITKTSSKNCWAWVNSSSSEAINAVGAASGTAQGYCTAGGVIGGEHFNPTPFSGCEPMDDPFAADFTWHYPDADNCDYSNIQLSNGTFTLRPGTYCGGIELKPQANVTLQSGIYVIRNGILKVQAGSTLTGNGVSVFFRGSGTTIDIRGGANVSLKAPASGSYAGFLFVDRTFSWETSTIDATVQGGGNIKLEGILYAPRWRVLISGNSQINQDSKFFAMIADSFYLEGNGQLFINSDNDAAGLPDLMPKIRSGPVITQ